MKAFKIQENPQGKLELAKSSLRAYLQAGLSQEGAEGRSPSVAIRVHEKVEADTELSRLGANIAEPLADHMHALAWLEQAGERLPRDQMLAERIVRLQVSMGLLADTLSRAVQSLDLAPGRNRQRLLAQIYDWNGHSDEALEMWLSFARAKADREAEARAFALAHKTGQQCSRSVA